ncbi:MAG TPA: prephenate dehydrogenase/arogenate dehydrogenase family protein [Gaiellaceae bacterium]|jgi:prephenate dehydrogenase
MDDLEELRGEIEEVDRALLGALNRRLELVLRVNKYKRETGTPVIDAEREATLVRELVDANGGPLSEAAVQAFFAAVLDVTKQDSRRDSRPAQAASTARAAAVASIAVVGTGLVGTSVGLAAKRSGSTRVAGWDADPAILGSSGLEAAGSLAEAVSGAELVVVAVPVGSLVEATRAVLDVASDDTTVTDVGSTKRALAQAIDDPRFVPGHPLAGGATGGPGRASADLFDGALWFLTPTPASEAERIALVEQFISTLGARSVRLDAATHDRLLAVTSHVPHALANLLMQNVATAGDEALGYAGASLREMTRVAGANPTVWTDIFLENADLIADALGTHRQGLEDVERALREADRSFFERWIAEAAQARSRMLEYAYRTEARMLSRIRVRIPDKPGVLARITQTLGAAGINIEDFELRHVSPEYGGVLVILVAGNDSAELARALLRRDGYSAA